MAAPRSGLELFRISGFPVRIHASWLIIFVLLAWSLAVGYFPSAHPGLSVTTYWAMGLLGSLGLFVSILLHELSHARVAQRLGLPMRGITLFLFGGEIIHGFATTLIVGVIIGTYSSIYVASTTLLTLGVSKYDLLVVEKEGANLDARP